METGIHYLLDWKGVDQLIANDATLLEACLLEAAHDAGCTVIGSMSHQFEPYGATSIIMLAESHISAHYTYETNTVWIDVFTCGDAMMPERAVLSLRAKLSPLVFTLDKVTRGVPS